MRDAEKLAIAVERLQGRRLSIPVLSELFHTWMRPIMRTEGTLDASLPQLPPEDSATELLAKFRPLWKNVSEDATGDGKTLRRVVLRLLSPRFPLLALWQLIDAASNFAQPLLIAALVRGLRRGESDHLDYGLAVLLFVATLSGAIAIQQVLWGGARMGMRAKIALSAAVYAKSLSLSNAALLSTSAGAATNLVAIDVNRLEQSFTFFHMLWYAPLVVVILGVVLGAWVAGAAALPGMLCLVLLFYAQRLVGAKIAALRGAIARQVSTLPRPRPHQGHPGQVVRCLPADNPSPHAAERVARCLVCLCLVRRTSVSSSCMTFLPAARRSRCTHGRRL